MAKHANAKVVKTKSRRGCRFAATVSSSAGGEATRITSPVKSFTVLETRIKKYAEISIADIRRVFKVPSKATLNVVVNEDFYDGDDVNLGNDIRNAVIKVQWEEVK